MSNFKGTYIDIDSIYDTRLPLAMLISPEITTIELKNGNYFKRVTNNIGIISSDIFLALYSVRNKRLMSMALITKLVDDIVIPQYIDTASDGSKVDLNNPPMFYVNTYPYNLNDKEKENLYNGLKKVLLTNRISIIDIPLKDITPEWIDKYVSLIYMYEGLNWLEYQINIGNVDNNPLVGISLVSPFILYGKYKDNKVNVQTIMDMYKPVIDLYLLDLELYSIKKKGR